MTPPTTIFTVPGAKLSFHWGLAAKGRSRLSLDKFRRLSGLEGVVLGLLTGHIPKLAHKPHHGDDLGDAKGEKEEHHNPQPILPIAVPSGPFGVGIIVVPAPLSIAVRTIHT